MLDRIKVHRREFRRASTFSTSLSARLGSRLSRCFRHEKFENISTLTSGILPHTCVKVCNIIVSGSYGSPWLRNLQSVRLCSVCMIVVLTVAGPPALQCSAQHRQRRCRVDLPLLKRPRESTNDYARYPQLGALGATSWCFVSWCVRVLVACFIIVVWR